MLTRVLPTCSAISYQFCYPSVSIIDLFYAKSSSRQNNNVENNLRESVLGNILSYKKTDEQYTNKIYGSKWLNVRNKWEQCLNEIYPYPYSNIKVTKKGGVGYNYDFEVIYQDKNGKSLCEKHVEFKHNSNSILKIPQFLCLTDKRADFMKDKYADYFYNNYLKEYMKVDQDIFSILEIPKKKEYLRLIHHHKYTVHPMFHLFHERKHHYKDKKDFIVNESIKTYLEKYSHTINLGILSKMVMSRQYNKVFCLWDLKKFHIETIEQEEIISVEGMERGNSLIVNTPTRQYKLLLRWKNDNGVLNPAWEISLYK